MISDDEAIQKIIEGDITTESQNETRLDPDAKNLLLEALKSQDEDFKRIQSVYPWLTKNIYYQIKHKMAEMKELGVRND